MEPFSAELSPTSGNRPASPFETRAASMETRRFAETSAFDSFDVLSVRIYPVKSCQAFEISPEPDHPGNVLNPAKFTKHGLEYDRRWAIVGREVGADSSVKWHVESVFEMHPELVRIKPVIERNQDLDSETGLQLRLTANEIFSGRDLVLPIRARAGSKERLFVDGVMGNPSLVYVEDEGPEAAAWLAEVLSKDDGGARRKPKATFHLVWMPPECSQKCAAHPVYGHLFYAHEQLAFAAKTQLHVVNLASLDDLNEVIKTKFPEDWRDGEGAIPVERFRPNIVIRTSFPWEEDAWKLMRVGGKHFSGSRGRDADEEGLDNDNHGIIIRTALSTIRCNQTTVNMADAEAGEESATRIRAGVRDKTMQPLKALKQYRASGPAGKKPKFGFGANRCFFRDSAAPFAEHAAREWVIADQRFAGPVVSQMPPSPCFEVGDKLTVVQHMGDEVAAVVECGAAGVLQRRQSADSFDYATAIQMGDKRAGILGKQGLEELTELDVNDAADQIERAAERTKSGDGSLTRVGVQFGGKLLCAWCCQRFYTERALSRHEKFAHDFPEVGDFGEEIEEVLGAPGFRDWWGEGSFDQMRKGLERMSTPRCNTDTIRSLETADTRRRRERDQQSERTPSRFDGQTEDEDGNSLMDLTTLYCDVHLG